MQQKIVITGGPSTGKTTVVNELIKRNYNCIPEISRQITLKAREDGIEWLFLKDPLLFSKLLLEGREKQYIDAGKIDSSLIFFDRGIPDVQAYMNYFGVDYPDIYEATSKKYKYSQVLLMPPWKEIYTEDEERYENFEQSLAIYNHLKNTYKNLGYKITEVPFGSVKERVDFILNIAKSKT